MPIDLTPHLDPAACSILVFECQENVIGTGSQIPGLVASVREGGILASIAGLLAAARKAGVGVFYCTAESRPDGLGRARTPMNDRMEREGGSRGPAPDVSIVKELAPEAGDVVIARGHGMSGFYETGLDPCLRDRGTRTIIPVGVSLNIGILGTTIEAVNHGYRVVVPRDCVVGDPPEYGEQVLRYAIRNLAYVSRSDDIRAAWA
jgi:nicotinamidase-related amidase